MKNNNQKKYPKESAGNQMITEVPKASLQDSIAQVESMLLKNIKNYELVEYIYVVDSKDNLKGVISIKELFRTNKQTKIKEIINRDLIYAHPYTDQEKVALTALKNNLKAVPIIDRGGKFLGAVIARTILKIMQTEAVEDALIYAGVSDGVETDITKISIIKSIKSRLPWLIIGLLGGLISAQIVGAFQSSLQSNIILAMFMPIVVYMADAVASQTQILLIRNLTTNHRLVLKQYLVKEIKISFIIAILCSLILSLISLIWHGQLYVGLVLGIALMFSIFMAVAMSILIPSVIKKLKKDPTLSSGPFTTIVTDILSLITYFSITTIMLGLL